MYSMDIITDDINILFGNFSGLYICIGTSSSEKKEFIYSNDESNDLRYFTIFVVFKYLYF